HTSLLSATAPSHLYTLSLHDALPISVAVSIHSHRPNPRHHPQRQSPPVALGRRVQGLWEHLHGGAHTGHRDDPLRPRARRGRTRSEEHTSELQSRFDLVCRLLLEKKK